jgi:peptidoglycan hydrolase-like protein with peptidoglycan-binding domain
MRMKLLTGLNEMKQLSMSPAAAAGVTLTMLRNICSGSRSSQSQKQNALQSTRFNECLSRMRLIKTDILPQSVENGRAKADDACSSESARTESSSASTGKHALNINSSSDVLSLIGSLFTIQSGDGSAGSKVFSGLHEGSRGDKVRALQQTLITWMPEWKGVLAVDGIYGPQTNKALEIFKKVNGFGRDGSSMDERSAAALDGVSRGDVLCFASSDGSTGKMKEKLQMAGAGSRSISCSGALEYSAARQRIADIAEASPRAIVRYQNHSLQASTAARFIELEKETAQRFPGMRLLITSTMDGRHQDPGHPAGTSIDFVAADAGYQPIDISAKQSQQLEQVCRDCGFETYNEYLRDSRYKTGPHMHVSCRDRSLSLRR